MRTLLLVQQDFLRFRQYLVYFVSAFLRCVLQLQDDAFEYFISLEKTG